ncbi:MAG TPA: hypothetical protein DEP35_14785 [Deltaproteobacteria bacterium]|nr:hypothetical protein [Deltaproteobacteria bacterium]
MPTFTTGLRNLTGHVNKDGTVLIYAITAQFSTISGGEPDPTKLVAVIDRLEATSLPTEPHPDGLLENFFTLQISRSGEVFRGVAFAPCRLFCGSDD